MRRAHPIRDLALAISQLTIVPIKASWPDDDRPDVAGWYPLVGLVLGLVAYGVAGSGWASSPLVSAAVTVVILALLTGGLHWDGLADVADAWHFSDPQRRVQVLKDSATGAFGTLAIALTALMQVAAITSLSEKGGASLIVIAVVSGRSSATFSAWLGKPARADGLGAAVSRRPGLSGWIGVGACALALVLIWRLGLFVSAGQVTVVAAAAGILAALVVPHVISGRFRGTSGDTMGASVMVVETVVLLTCCLGVLW